jgi:hypothetical protein
MAHDPNEHGEPSAAGGVWPTFAGLLSGGPSGAVCGFVLVEGLRRVLPSPVGFLAIPIGLWTVATTCAAVGGLAGGTVAALFVRRKGAATARRPLWLSALLGLLVGGFGGAIFGWHPLGSAAAAGGDALPLVLGLGLARGAAYGALGGLAGGAVGAATAGGEYL